LTPRWSSESVCLYRKPLADSSSWMRGLTCRSVSLGGLRAAIPGGGLQSIARASGGALCPAQRHRPGPVSVVRVGRCGGGDVSLPGFRVGPAARACPAESSKATAVCKHPAAANRKSIKNPEFNSDDVDTDMLQRLQAAIDSGDLKIINMHKIRMETDHNFWSFSRGLQKRCCAN
jgi:hypothetical protein